MSILGPLIIFGAIVLVHELGHFLVARATGMAVLEFSIGIGPALWQRQFGETTFSLRLIPIIHFVRIAGMEAEEDAAPGIVKATGVVGAKSNVAGEGADQRSADPERADPGQAVVVVGRGFYSRPVWARMLVLFAGSGMNFLLAYLLLVTLTTAIGFASGTQLRDVVPGQAAAEAGLRAGDKVLRVNEVVDPEVNDFIREVAGAKGSVQVTVEREGRALPPIAVTPREMKPGEPKRMGVVVQPMHRRAGLGKAVLGSAVLLAVTTVRMVEGFGQLITGKAGRDGLMGPVGIARMTSDYSKEAGKSDEGWFDFLIMFALISTNIGFINLLPIPALDGSRILFQAIAGVLRRPVNPRIEGTIHAVGMILILGLAAWISVGDVGQAITGAKPWANP